MSDGKLTVEDPATCWLKGEPDEEGWYWMDYHMFTPIFPAFWTGHHWENSGGKRLNVEQFDAEWQGPITPIGRTIKKQPSD